MLQPTFEMPLGRHILLETAEADRARTHLSGLFWPHRIALTKGDRAINFRHHCAVIGDLSLNALRYGCEVNLDVAPSDAAYLVKFTLAGNSCVSQHDREIVTSPGTVCVMNPDLPLSVHLSSGYNQLTLRIDGAKLNQFLSTALGYRPRRVLEFLPYATPFQHNASGLAYLVKTLLDERETSEPGIEAAPLTAYAEASLFASLLHELPHTYSRELAEAHQPEPHTLIRARQYIARNLSRPITLPALAAATSVSQRTLQTLFRRHLDTTPMAYVHDERLTLARTSLLAVSTASVTDVALSCGFTHLGRFSRDYRDRYGELPSDTRRRD